MNRTLLTLSSLALLAALGGCNQTMTAADIRGACDAFERPSGVVLGKRRADQRQIDSWIESGVSACGWSRPKAQQIVGKYTH